MNILKNKHIFIIPIIIGFVSFVFSIPPSIYHAKINKNITNNILKKLMITEKVYMIDRNEISNFLIRFWIGEKFRIKIFKYDEFDEKFKLINIKLNDDEKYFIYNFIGFISNNAKSYKNLNFDLEYILKKYRSKLFYKNILDYIINNYIYYLIILFSIGIILYFKKGNSN